MRQHRRGSTSVDAEGRDIFTIASYSLVGGSTGSYTFDQVGGIYGTNGGPFEHHETFTETTTTNIGGSAAYNLNTGDLVGNWSYTNFLISTTLTQADTDTIKGKPGSGGMTRTIAYSDPTASGNGTLTNSGSGSASVNGRGASFSGSNQSNLGTILPPAVPYQSRTINLQTIRAEMYVILPFALVDIEEILDAVAAPMMLGGQMPTMPDPTLPSVINRFTPTYSALVYDLYLQLLKPEFRRVQHA